MRFNFLKEEMILKMFFHQEIKKENLEKIIERNLKNGENLQTKNKQS